MTKGEVSALVTLLMACYPAARFPDGTQAAYELFLVELEHERAKQAVSHIVRTSRFMPTIADVLAAYEDTAPPAERTNERYLGPRYTGPVLKPRELSSEIADVLRRLS